MKITVKYNYTSPTMLGFKDIDNVLHFWHIDRIEDEIKELA